MLESFVPNDKIVLKKNPELLRRRQRRDRRGAVAALRGPLGVPAPLRGRRGPDLRRRPGRADGLHEGEAAGAAPDRALSRRLLPAGEDDEGEVRRPAGAPGDLDADRPRLHRRRGLAGHHAAGLLAGAAGDRQLRRRAAGARPMPPTTCSTARTRRWRSSRRPASIRRRWRSSSATTRRRTTATPWRRWRTSSPTSASSRR